jgi:hypothetical protein
MAVGTDYLLKYKIVADAFAAKAEIKSLDDAFKQVGSRAATSLGSLAAPAGVAIGAITGVGAALFGLTKQAAEYGSVIHDASDKTGLHAETLTAMDLAAKQSNTSLEQVTKAVSKFSVQVDAAAQGSKEATAMLERFGLTPQKALNDLDGALGKVFQKIVNTTNVNERAGLAAAAFGKKMGTELLPFIKQFDGDLPKLIAKAKELGVTMSDQDAAAADAFGDEMDQLQVQIGAATRAIGKEFMPAFTHMAEDVSSWLAENKDQTKSWAESFAEYLTDLSFKIKLLGIDAREAAAEISALFNSGLMADTSRPTALDLPKIYEQFQKERQAAIDRAVGGGPDYGEPYLPGGRRPGDKTGTDTATSAGSKKADKIGDAAPSKRAVEVLKAVIAPSKFDAAMKEAASQVSKETGIDEDIVFTLLKATVFRESSGIAGQTSSAGAKGLTQQMAGTTKRLGPGNEFVKAARYLTRGFGGEGYEAGGPSEAFATYFAGGSGTGRGAKTKAYVRDQSWVFQHAKQILDGLDKVAKKDKEVSDDSIKNDEEATARKYEIGQAFAASMVELHQQEYESSLKYNDFNGAYKAAQDAHDQIVQNVQDEIAALEEKAAKTKADSVEEKRANDAVTLAKVLGDRTIRQADNDLAKSIEEVQGKQADLFIKITQDADTAKDAIDRLGVSMGGLMDEVIKSTNDQAAHEMDKTGRGSFLDALFGGLGVAEMQSDIDLRKSMLADLGSFTADIFGQMANAVGQSIEAWALYGESLGTALKKATAQVLAQVAAQAAVKAIFELAEGFASLAIGDGRGAALHFTSAAIYGTIALGAAIGAKAVAGDSFKNKGGSKGAAAGASGGYGGGSSSSQPLQPYSRSGPDTFISGRRPQDPATMALAVAVDKLQQKINGMSPGDVLVRGTAQRPGHITQTHINEVGSNPSYSKQILQRYRVK